jgi:regulator of protease activity HflC (stomatin/prohibitin superfamily)
MLVERLRADGAAATRLRAEGATEAEVLLRADEATRAPVLLRGLATARAAPDLRGADFLATDFVDFTVRLAILSSSGSYFKSSPAFTASRALGGA